MGLLNCCASVKAYPASKKGNHLCDSNARLAKYLAALPAKLRRYIWAAALVRTQPPTKGRRSAPYCPIGPPGAGERKELGVFHSFQVTLYHRISMT